MSTSWIVQLFSARLAVEQQQCDAALGLLDGPVAALLPHSNDVLAQRAVAHYTMRDFDAAQVCVCVCAWLLLLLGGVGVVSRALGRGRGTSRARERRRGVRGTRARCEDNLPARN